MGLGDPCRQRLLEHPEAVVPRALCHILTEPDPAQQAAWLALSALCLRTLDLPGIEVDVAHEPKLYQAARTDNRA